MGHGQLGDEDWKFMSSVVHRGWVIEKCFEIMQQCVQLVMEHGYTFIIPYAILRTMTHTGCLVVNYPGHRIFSMFTSNAIGNDIALVIRHGQLC